MANFRKAFTKTALLLCSTSLPCLASAQTSTQGAVPAPVRETIDGDGVDLSSGLISIDLPALTIGDPARGGLSYSMFLQGSYYRSSFEGYVQITSTTATVSIGRQSEVFNISGSVFSAQAGSSSTLMFDGSKYYYTKIDGTVVQFWKDTGTNVQGPASGIMIHTITRPNGLVTTFSYQDQTVRITNAGAPVPVVVTARRLGSVSTNAGYGIRLLYKTDTLSTQSDLGNFLAVKGAAGYLTCAAGSADCPSTGTLPTMTVSLPTGNGTISQTDALGKTTSYAYSNGNLTSISYPGSSSPDVSISYANGLVSSVTRSGATTNYSFVSDANANTWTATATVGSRTPYIYVFNLQTKLLQKESWQTSAGGAIYSKTYTYENNLPKTVTNPEGDQVRFTYDFRYRLVETRQISKTPGTPADLVTSLTYPASCGITAGTCALPVIATDANNNQTNYTYDQNTGNVLTVVQPAASTGAPRPTTSYSYTNINGISMLTGVSSCSTASTCVGSANETKTTIQYNAISLPKSVTTAAGDNSVSASVAAVYDVAGNKISDIDPLGNETRYRYDAVRRLRGTVSPDPDGSGPSPRVAKKYSYDDAGRSTSVAVGTVVDSSDSAWDNFLESYRQTNSYNAAGQLQRQTITSNGTDYAVGDFLYDNAGQQTCSIQYMDPSRWNVQASSCAPRQTDGPYGPDRVTQAGYDTAGHLTSVTTGVGTDAISMELRDYTPNGQIRTVKDGNTNPTVYGYDSFDRQTTKSFADGSYEQLGYDANSNVTSRRLRDGTTIGYGYDALNRVTSKTPPSPDYAVAYGYDLLGRVTSVSRSADGVSHGFTYDALSRLLSEGQPFGSVAYQYDAAGRRTRLTWSDGNYVTYEYLATGAISAIRENGSGLLASYGYDSLGRRASLTRGNGAVTSYGYDAVSRLASLSHDLGGTAYDVSTSFSYNPAGQIAAQTRSNDAYAWNGAINVDRSYGVNALNQLTSAGSTSLGYDGRGNLTNSGSSSYTYSSENLMKTAPGGISLHYDALDRLAEYDTNVSTRFVYDGSHMAAEIANPSGAIQRRYVFGPGDDEPLVWYEGSGLSDRRWLVGDERGSVVATTDGSGNVTGVNSYDEYGIPAAGNIGRFQYTGQAWLPELGMSYYKARIYSPSLGRFMQSDPIGYVSGLNWYNYVGSDPINYSDPSGLAAITIPTNVCSQIHIPYAGPASSDPNNILVNGGSWSIKCTTGLTTINVPDLTYAPPASGGKGNPQPGKGGPCGGIPSPGLSRVTTNKIINDNASTYNLIRDSAGRAPGLADLDSRAGLFVKSAPGQEYDTKSSFSPRYVAGSAEYGNFLFGANAAAIGMSLDETLSWAANAQIVQDILKLKIPSGHDNPGDAAMIAKGFKYYTSGCTK